MDKLKCGVYRHFKGNLYLLLAQASHSETLEEMIVYQALYGERGIWVRPRVMWDEQVTYKGSSVMRFTYVGDEISGSEYD